MESLQILTRSETFKKEDDLATLKMSCLLMACQYNAKFTFDNSLNLSYEEVTAPLRKLLKKGQKFTLETQ